MTRGEIESEIDELFGGGGKATQVYRGLAKVLEDRAEFEVVADVPPDVVREKVFTAAADYRRQMRSSRGRPGPSRRVPARRDLERRGRRAEHRARGRLDVALRRPARREPAAVVRRHDGPAADRPLQRRAGAGGPAPIGAGQGRGPQRAARAVSPALSPAQVSPPALPGRGEHARRLRLPHRRPLEPLQRDDQVRPPGRAVPAGALALLGFPARSRAALGPEARAAELPPRVARRPGLAPGRHRHLRPGRAHGVRRAVPPGRARLGDQRVHRRHRAGPRRGLGPRLPARPHSRPAPTSSSRSWASGSGRAWNG